MSKSMSSARIERLNLLLKTIQGRQYISRENLIAECKYISARTLESDLRFLRGSFGVKIRYSRSKSGYVFEDGGKYILDGAKRT